LLQRLFELWPECPAEFLVGDRLFGHSKGFLRTVIFAYWMWPITPWRADYPTDAVPRCRCGRDERPMEFGRLKDKFWGPHKRVARTATAATCSRAPTKLRVEYVCPFKTCKPQYGSVYGLSAVRAGAVCPRRALWSTDLFGRDNARLARLETRRREAHILENGARFSPPGMGVRAAR
jgi:hypothetical protein